MIYKYHAWLSFDVSKENSYKLIEKSIKIACGAVSASHRQLRAYSPLECVKVKVNTDNIYVDVSGSTQHEIYRWVVHFYPRISGDYHEFQRVLLAVSHILLNRDAKTHKSRKIFANFLEPVLIISVITLI